MCTCTGTCSCRPMSSLWTGAEWTGRTPQFPWQPGHNHHHIRTHTRSTWSSVGGLGRRDKPLPSNYTWRQPFFAWEKKELSRTVQMLYQLYKPHVLVHDGGLVAMEFEVHCHSILPLATAPALTPAHSLEQHLTTLSMGISIVSSIHPMGYTLYCIGHTMYWPWA